MPKTITIDIDTQGNPTVSTKGFAGAECEQATAALESALGARTKNVRTGEFHHTVDTTRKVGV